MNLSNLFKQIIPKPKPKKVDTSIVIEQLDLPTIKEHVNKTVIYKECKYFITKINLFDCVLYKAINLRYNNIEVRFKTYKNEAT